MLYTDPKRVETVWLYNTRTAKAAHTKEEIDNWLEKGELNVDEAYLSYRLPGMDLPDAVLWSELVNDGGEYVIRSYLGSLRNKAPSRYNAGQKYALEQLKRCMNDKELLSLHQPDPIESGPKRMARVAKEKADNSKVMEVETAEILLAGTDTDAIDILLANRDTDQFDTQQSSSSYDANAYLLEKDPAMMDDDETVMSEED